MISESDRAILNSIFNPLTPIAELPGETLDIHADTKEESEYDKQISRMEIKSINLAESGDLKSARELLTEAIKKSPKRPSLYNNRAQVYRLEGFVKEALTDLEEAIILSKGGVGKSGCQALCQRALLYEKMGKKEEAIKDWTTAARNGSEYAKSMVVKMNPYAALCNQMLSVVMKTLNNPSVETEENK